MSVPLHVQAVCSKIMDFLHAEERAALAFTCKAAFDVGRRGLKRRLLARLFGNADAELRLEWNEDGVLVVYARTKAAPAPFFVRVRNRFRNSSAWICPSREPHPSLKYFMEDGAVYAGENPGFDVAAYDTLAVAPLRAFPKVALFKKNDFLPVVEYEVKGELTLDFFFNCEEENLWPNFVNDRYGHGAQSCAAAMHELMSFMSVMRDQGAFSSVSTGDRLNPEFVREWSDFMREGIMSDDMNWFNAFPGPRVFNSLAECMGGLIHAERAFMIQYI